MDAAARGAYIVGRDLDTVSRMVRRAHTRSWSTGADLRSRAAAGACPGGGCGRPERAHCRVVRGQLEHHLYAEAESEFREAS